MYTHSAHLCISTLYTVGSRLLLLLCDLCFMLNLKKKRKRGNSFNHPAEGSDEKIELKPPERHKVSHYPEHSAEDSCYSLFAHTHRLRKS